VTHNLPAVPTQTFGPGGTPLSEAPTAALAFALGYVVTQRVDPNHFGPFVALCDELRRRRGGHGEPGSPSEWTFLMAALPEEVGRAVSMLYQMQRGQQWAQTGRKPK
jgi:hypothetical protein